MEIHVDGNRSSSENWMRAHTASPRDLPEWSSEQKAVAARLGLEDEAYARSLLAGDLERKDLEQKAERAARLIERLASRRMSNVRVESVWLKTFDEKFVSNWNLKGVIVSCLLLKMWLMGYSNQGPSQRNGR